MANEYTKPSYHSANPFRVMADELPEHQFTYWTRRNRVRALYAMEYQGACSCRTWRENEWHLLRRFASMSHQKHIEAVINQERMAF